MKNTILALEFATNLFGPWSEQRKAEVAAFLENPTEENWEEIYSLILHGEGKPGTIWQAVAAVDPSFPKGLEMKKEGNSRWTKIPTPETLLKALRAALIKTTSN